MTVLYYVYLYYILTISTQLRMSHLKITDTASCRPSTMEGMKSTLPAKFSTSCACSQGSLRAQSSQTGFYQLGRHSAILMRSDTSINTEREW